MAGIPLITHKRGDTFELLGNIPDSYPDGSWVGWVVSSQVRDAFGTLASTAVCEWSDPATTRILSIKILDTTAWPLGSLEIDVQFKRASDGYVRSTTTQPITVIRDVTI